MTDDAAGLVRSLHPLLKRKVRAAFKLILADPMAGKALKDELEGLRSFRVSRFRIVYKTGKDAIDVVAVGPRKTIYEETLLLVRKEN
ncbi:MAG: type II toxin-antitoxin system RelE/ParE family toxin [Nitrospirae bacterium]|nr:type II toxin-antitoxin system RelE/ParE family toxin [Nitrospirota bacterium]